MEVFIDGNVLGKRLEAIYKKAWPENGEDGFVDTTSGRAVDALAIITGKSTEDLRYMKSIALEMWLFAYELPETALVCLRNKTIHLVTGKTKAKLISSTKDVVKETYGIDIVIHTRVKGTTGDEHFKTVLDLVKSNSKAEEGEKALIGGLPKDKHEGTFFDTWNTILKEKEADVTQVDVSSGFAKILAI